MASPRDQRLTILVEGKDKTGKALSGVQKRFAGLKKAVFSLKGALAGLAIGAFAKSAVNAFKVQELAEKRLESALGILGEKRKEAIQQQKEFAAGIQKITTLGDEEVLAVQALGASLGRLSGRALMEATTAAIGLAKALGIDTVAAMRLVARAAIGDTSSLSRYGIKLDTTRTKQEQFNQLLKIGAENFAVATGEIETDSGKLQQILNELGDVSEKFGARILAAFTQATTGSNNLLESIRTVNIALAQSARAEAALRAQQARATGRPVPGAGDGMLFGRPSFRRGVIANVLERDRIALERESNRQQFIDLRAIDRERRERRVIRPRQATAIASTGRAEATFRAQRRQGSIRDIVQTGSFGPLADRIILEANAIGGRFGQALRDSIDRSLTQTEKSNTRFLSEATANLRKLARTELLGLLDERAGLGDNAAARQTLRFRAEADIDRLRELQRRTGADKALFESLIGIREENLQGALGRVGQMPGGGRGAGAAFEARFLGLAPGAATDPIQKTEKNTKDIAEQGKKTNTKLDQLIKVFGRDAVQTLFVRSFR